MTNFEKFKNDLTIDLATEIFAMGECSIPDDYCIVAKDGGCGRPNNTCSQCAREWLESEVEHERYDRTSMQIFQKQTGKM